MIIRSEEIYKKANSIVRSCGTRDTLKIARELGIYVHYIDTLNDLLGMYTYRHKERHILLNSGMEHMVMQMVCGHEIGHDVFHRDLAKKGNALPEFTLFDMRSKPEYEANAFAAHLIIDNDELVEYMQEGYDVVQLSAMMGTNINLMLIKLNEMNRMGWGLNLLYKLFGKNAELLIDHAWGWEPCTVEAIKAYKPSTNSLGSGQVLHCPYEAEKAKLVLREMADLLVLDLVDKGLVTDQIVITVGYDIENLTDPERSRKYHGTVVKDHYGRQIPKQAHGSINLDGHTSSTKKIMCATAELFDRIVDKNLLVRRLNITANHVVPEADAPVKNGGYEQLDLFTDFTALEAQRKREKAELDREKKMQQAMLIIKKKYGKNAILKGMNLEEGATAKDRNEQIGGHKA